MTDVPALQRTLAGEHAAMWVYGVLGGQSSPERDKALHDSLVSSYGAHRARRDLLIRTVLDAGGTPIPAEVGYQIPVTDGAPDGLAAVALDVERKCAALYADLVARSTGAQRAWAVQSLTDAAVRQLRFRGSPETFPGAGELADR